MQIISKKNFVIALAAVLVIAMGIMALALTSQQISPKNRSYEKSIEKMETQSSSDDVNDIEKDLMETDLSDLDKELNDIEKEIESF